MVKSFTAIVQARENSSRFPGKVLEKINGITIIEIIFKRLKLCKNLNEIIFAITKRDKKILKILKKNNIKYFIGSEKNVLKRYYECSKKYKVKNIVRITADCPLLDFNLIDQMIFSFKNKKIDFLSNNLIPTFPDGHDVEIFNFESLQRIFTIASSEIDKEHVTFPFTHKKNNFKILNYENKLKNNVNLRLTLDNHQDLTLIRNIFEYYNFNFKINSKDIESLKKIKPEIFLENKIYKRDYGLNFKKNKFNWEDSNKIIPGGNQMISKNPMYLLPYQWPLYYTKAEGIKIWTTENLKFYDYSIMGVGTNILGYSNKNVNRHVKKCIDYGSMSTINSFEEYKLAEELIEMNPWADMVRFARTGGEINSLAIRVARASTGKNKIAFCGYHGWHDWYLSANLSNKNNLNSHLMKGFYTSGVPKYLKNTSFGFEFNNILSLKRLLKKEKDIGIIKLEIFRNYKPKLAFLKEIRKICSEKNIVLIFDECTSGFRASYGGVYKKFKIEPDIVLFGKALGNGFPITACVGKKEIMENFKKTFASSTFWSERIGFVAGLATLNEMKRVKSWERVNELGNYFRNCINQISNTNNLKIKLTGLPALTSYEIIHKNSNLFHAYITQEMLKQKILSTQSFYLSTCHSKKGIEFYVGKLDKVFKEISKNKDNKNFIDFLDGPLPKKPFSRMN
jgi:glutamate-1-semialdehyde 2,1-aminomutase